jgi:hypothetical protein
MTLSEASAKFLNRPDKLKDYINAFKHKNAEPSKDDWVSYIRSKKLKEEEK